jgi:F0F1-type ATP synthase assembly protein I
VSKPGDNSYFQYLSLGVEIAAGLSIPILAGYWIDRSWDTLPWFTFLGILTGVAIMLIIMIRTARDVSAKNGDK